jgi:hypothetical protein
MYVFAPASWAELVLGDQIGKPKYGTHAGFAQVLQEFSLDLVFSRCSVILDLADGQFELSLCDGLIEMVG